MAGQSALEGERPSPAASRHSSERGVPKCFPLPLDGRRRWKGKGPARRLRAIVRGAAFPNAFRRPGKRGRQARAALGRAGGPKGERPSPAASRHRPGRGVPRRSPPPRKKGLQGFALGRAVGPERGKAQPGGSRHSSERGVPKCFPPPLDGRRRWKGKGPARRLRAIGRSAAFPNAFRRPEKKGAKRPAVLPSRAAFRRPEKKGPQGARCPWPGRRPRKGKGPARRLCAIVRGAAFPNAFRCPSTAGGVGRGKAQPGGFAP